jgi:uncharacterized membrane protein YgcG
MRLLLGSVAVALFAAIFAMSPATARAGTTNRQLDATLPELRLDGVSLADSIDFLRDVSDANIVVNWKALEEAGVSRDAPVTLHLRNISLRKAMQLILSEASGGDKLSFTLDQGVIEITTQELADQKMFTCIYPVDDLIMDVPDFTDAPDFSLSSTSNNTAQNPSGSSGGVPQAGGVSSSPFGGSNGGGGANGTDQGKTKTERADDLIKLIEATVQPDIWKDNGGTASITYFNGNLIVTAPRSVQEAIGGSMDD